MSYTKIILQALIYLYPSEFRTFKEKKQKQKRETQYNNKVYTEHVIIIIIKQKLGQLQYFQHKAHFKPTSSQLRFGLWVCIHSSAFFIQSVEERKSIRRSETKTSVQVRQSSATCVLLQPGRSLQRV